MNSTGVLEVICGPMFAGKTGLLIDMVEQAAARGNVCQVFKHVLDNRFDGSNVVTHAGRSYTAQSIDSPLALCSSLRPDVHDIFIDEIQFFDYTMHTLCFDLVKSGKHVFVAGLDLDYRADTFGCMPLFLSSADVVHKIAGVCEVCGGKARFTQRITNGKSACLYEKTIIVGLSDRYQTRCWNCFEVSKTCCER
jgi:thymidine kinase